MSEDCTKLSEALLDWVDGRATPGDAARVEAHLATCARCRATAGPLHGAGPLALGRVDVPEQLLASMHAQLDRRLDALAPRPAPAPPGWLAWLFSGDLTVPKPLAWGAVAALVLLWSGRAPSAPPVRPSPPPSAVLIDGVDLFATPGSSRSS